MLTLTYFVLSSAQSQRSSFRPHKEPISYTGKRLTTHKCLPFPNVSALTCGLYILSFQKRYNNGLLNQGHIKARAAIVNLEKVSLTEGGHHSVGCDERQILTWFQDDVVVCDCSSAVNMIVLHQIHKV